MATATMNLPIVLDEPLYEMDNGDKYEVAPMGVFAATIASMLSGWMNAFAAPRQLGFAVTETVFEWDSENGKLQRRPDVAFIRFDRWQPPPDWQNDPPAFQVVPNLAVEAISPTNTADSVETKIVEYFAAGVELVWVIYPRQRRIYVHQSPSQAKVLQINDELDGGNVLPGFKVKLSDLFAVPQANPRFERQAVDATQ
jgi:Uma2 family endonuclease